jgi:hypothetical protein
MRSPKLLSLLCLALFVAGVIAAVSHEDGRNGHFGVPAAAPSAGSEAGAPAPPGGAASPTGGTTPARAARATRASSSRPVPAGARATAPQAAPVSSGSRAYPGTVTCNDDEVPASTPYAWTCTHSDGTPVRWSASTLRVWVEGISSLQRSALESARAKWTPHSGITLVPATSASSADVVVTQVGTLGDLPKLGADILEYAVTHTHYTAGYYDSATIEVADIPTLGYNDWLDTFMHELGHLSGLDHVASPTEVMRPLVGFPQTNYGPGDIAGLQSERPQ